MGTNEILTLVVYFGAFIAIFYLFIIWPRRKQEKKHSEMLAGLRKGDKVVTIGGIKGEIAKVKDDTFLVRVNDNTEIEFLKKAIAYKVED
ncbi:protein translocase subunit yajC [Thermosyntropha lipolytica DSM 11003]|uniref:Protein translocase subunit yajC n=1 Tax=Thermosyntropha lipolytica DSM 11003 TaxID=1123382 RepID=A0A1M5P975_9FIRM|nr:preprotein translocase subunit YajC [Thermosyntropha lipolytica]SHG98381.1 protein translocase subunit yajC [Thermosyntropha lipolytica DSM 11003]